MKNSLTAYVFGENNNSMNLYKNYFKRIIDFVLSILILLIIAPVILFVMLSICISNMTFNIFFLQLRPGEKGKLFWTIKFKTMQDLYNQKGELMPDSIRVTKIGKLLRASSFDELPQLFNVIKGDMSLVGPRPLLPEYLPKYTNEQARRHEVRPGITGWAQINGRNTATFTERFKNDVWYVDNISFFLDIKILLITLLKVFKSEGILDEDPNTINEIKD